MRELSSATHSSALSVTWESKNNWNRPCDLGRCSRVHGNSGGNIRGDERCAQRVGEFARRCKRPDLPVIASPITSRTFGPCSSDERAETWCPVGLENKFSTSDQSEAFLCCPRTIQNSPENGNPIKALILWLLDRERRGLMSLDIERNLRSSDLK